MVLILTTVNIQYENNIWGKSLIVRQQLFFLSAKMTNVAGIF